MKLEAFQNWPNLNRNFGRLLSVFNVVFLVTSHQITKSNKMFIIELRNLLGWKTSSGNLLDTVSFLSKFI